MNWTISEITTDFERQWLQNLLIQSWGSNIIIRRGQVENINQHPTLVARDHTGEPSGYLSFQIKDQNCEVIVLESIVRNRGVGTVLLNCVKNIAIEAGCHRIWLITTNDNVNALRFYQKRGYHLIAVYPDAIDESRKIKPQIPLLGNDGIPLRDELELELIL